ncbi:XTP/dITP diphosphatase [Pullulanibacillus sp. KACC 23026]|uniref:XTP/dITP diphosphatase n=1 Tax=Pullulanibacillus sp. KACC 23026 TaxID=3028315 RepID=UPI0023B098E7|nr:XTP/dITP diphosphatase [Pullulanibacillus sp. KACC 23026]WEG13955.1 XTP/dITP diphosphatase [Pullulanibacillus sp. KACC 23026]
MTTLLLATTNAGKKREFEHLFRDFDIDLKTLADFSDAPDVEETGETFKENAGLKAETISRRYNISTLADDSGLAVKALGGRPGVYSARYAGVERNDQANVEKVLEELKDVPKEEREATFYCVLALAIPGKATRYIEGTLSGYITKEPIGHEGFGYDPIFYVPHLGKTLAELTSDEKNKISHRAQAFQTLKELWPEIEGDLK